MPRVFVAAFGGAPDSGKSTLVRSLVPTYCGENPREVLPGIYCGGGFRVCVICQDGYRAPHKDIVLQGGSYDEAYAINHDSFHSAINCALENKTLDLILVEGYKVYHDPRVVELFDVCVWLDVPRSDLEQRKRRKRTGKPKKNNFCQEAFDRTWDCHRSYQKDAFRNTEASGKEMVWVPEGTTKEVLGAVLAVMPNTSKPKRTSKEYFDALHDQEKTFYDNPRQGRNAARLCLKQYLTDRNGVVESLDDLLEFSRNRQRQPLEKNKPHRRSEGVAKRRRFAKKAICKLEKQTSSSASACVPEALGSVALTTVRRKKFGDMDKKKFVRCESIIRLLRAIGVEKQVATTLEPCEPPIGASPTVGHWYRLQVRKGDADGTRATKAFHGSHVDAIPAILKDGLKAGGRITRGHAGVYCEGGDRCGNARGYMVYTRSPCLPAEIAVAVLYELLVDKARMTGVNGQWCFKDAAAVLVSAVFVHAINVAQVPSGECMIASQALPVPVRFQ